MFWNINQFTSFNHNISINDCCDTPLLLLHFPLPLSSKRERNVKKYNIFLTPSLIINWLHCDTAGLKEAIITAGICLHCCGRCWHSIDINYRILDVQIIMWQNLKCPGHFSYPTILYFLKKTFQSPCKCRFNIFKWRLFYLFELLEKLFFLLKLKFDCLNVYNNTAVARAVSVRVC